MDQRRHPHGFTLIDTVITVVIIAILAAMVLPHFTDMSSEAMEANVQSQLKTIRSQIGLHDYENPETPFNPLVPGGPAAWTQLTANDYLRSAPENPLQNDSTMVAVIPMPGMGWVWNDPLGTGMTIYAVNASAGFFDADGDGTPD